MQSLIRPVFLMLAKCQMRTTESSTKSASTKDDSFLVTGNLKHFPKEPQVITAAEMMEILDNEL